MTLPSPDSLELFYENSELLQKEFDDFGLFNSEFSPKTVELFLSKKVEF